MRECKTGAVHQMRLDHECCKLVDKWFSFDKDGNPEACPGCGNFFVALTFKAKFDEEPYADQWACPRCLNRENIKLKQLASEMYEALKGVCLRYEASVEGGMINEWKAAVAAAGKAQNILHL